MTASLTVSFGQAEQAARKAARGAGLAWGLADEVGKAVRRLHENDLDGASALAALLGSHDYADYASLAPTVTVGGWHARGGVLDPLICGATLNDCIARLKDAPIEMMTVAHPLLVAGFVDGARHGGNVSVVLEWDDVQLYCSRDGVALNGDASALNTKTTASLNCRLTAADHATSSTKPEHATVTADAWQHLNHFAARTYVAATDASRIKGAGAGLQDND